MEKGKMKPNDKAYWQGLLALLVLGILITIAMFSLDKWLWTGKPIVQKPVFPIVSREMLRKAMHFHGINFAEQNKEGEWYFQRDGKCCWLFDYLDAL